MWTVLLLATLAQAPRAGATVERQLAAMGTTLSVSITAPERATALAASEAAVRAIEAAEERLSTWSEGGELARLNRAPVGEWRALSAALEADLAAARALARETDGAFDPGLGALVAAWGLRSGGRQPAPEELAAARAVGGLRAFEFEPGRARRLHALAAFEEGGFGKGLALDQACAAARAAGAEALCLDLGGQVRVEGLEAFELRLADPRERARPVLALRLSSGSLATSGNGERGIRVDGVARGHLLDPSSGAPSPDFGSLSVLAPEATRADALSTGLYVQGPEAALRHAARQPELAVIVLEAGARGLRARLSPVLKGRVRALDPTLELVFEPVTSTPTSSTTTR